MMFEDDEKEKDAAEVSPDSVDEMLAEETDEDEEEEVTEGGTDEEKGWE